MADALTATGLSIDDLATRRAAVVAELRSKISAILDFSPNQPTGQMLDIPLERLQAALELLQATHAATDPDQATGRSLDAVSSISGTYREPATKGTVAIDCTFVGAGVAAAGDVVAVSGDPDNQWVVDADIVAGGAGVFSGTATAALPGVYDALAATVTVIVSTADPNWTAVTNPAAAAAGEEQEKDEALRIRRELEVTLGGSTSVDAIRAEMLRADGAALDQCFVYENDSALPLGSMPPNSIELVWWENSVISDARRTEISEYLWAAKPAGIQAYGTELLTGPPVGPIVVVDDQGQSHVVSHTIATDLTLQCEYTIDTDGTYPGDVVFKQAVVDWVEENLGIGEDVSYFRMANLAFTVAGVTALTSYRQRWGGGAWVTTDLAVGDREIATLAAVDVTVI
jgi:hypothetical protein